MKYLLVFIFTSFTSICGYTQSLEGEWKGMLKSEFLPVGDEQLKLYFQPINDTGYHVYSYCRGRKANGEDTIVVAKVSYTQIRKNNIYLEETEVLKPRDVVNNCLVKMNLKILQDKDEIILSGDWTSECSDGGTIIFKRKVKPKL